MQIRDWQKEVDQWITTVGVRYFDIKTNTILLMEEVGEVARLVARIHGEQSFKNHLSVEEQQNKLKEEIADVLFVITCIANQSGIDLDAALKENIEKKSNRDAKRHQGNPKLKGPLL
ncbi:MAG: nucleotide pyrophosphohydrolase [Saprospiraceae bacterium]|nr:nucleotide pyrophosphohydrolase [Saprospiraceae bacterium]